MGSSRRNKGNKKKTRNKRKGRKLRKKSRIERKNYRKSHKISLKLPRKKNIHKKRLRGGARGRPDYPNRIGFELEACFLGDRASEDPHNAAQHWSAASFAPSVNCLALTDNDLADNFFSEQLEYFDMTIDDSIQCSKRECSIELVLTDDKTFTYDDGSVYMDAENITSQLIDEILLISSKAKPCQEDSCGFHVHMSDTRPGYSLDSDNGKIFLLKALALWCGIDGITEGEQNTTFGDYVRDSPPSDSSEKSYAEKLDKLSQTNFEIIYDLATRGELENRALLDYLDKVYFKILESDWPYEYHGLRYFAFNIYFLGEGDRLARENPRPDIDKVEDPRPNYDVRLEADLWSKPLRIEFRGHRDLIKVVMGEIEPYKISKASEDALKMMVGKPVDRKEIAKASVFYEKLTAYLDTINSFFERAKVYEPLNEKSKM